MPYASLLFPRSCMSISSQGRYTFRILVAKEPGNVVSASPTSTIQDSSLKCGWDGDGVSPNSIQHTSPTTAANDLGSF